SDFKKYENYAKSLGISPYMFFLASFFLVLYKYTNQEHLIIGTPIAGRDLEELQDLVGMFVNNIVLSYEINKNDTILEFLSKIKETSIDALTYQPYPFDKLVKKLNLPKDTSRNPLFDVMFIYQNMPSKQLSLNNKTIKFMEAKTDISKFDLSLEIIPSSHTIRLEYSTNLFKKHTMDQFMSHYLEALENMYQNSNKKISEISILSQKEKDYLLNDFNKTYLYYPQNETISTLFEKQVEQTPNAIALTFHNTKLTFDELNKKANSLANYLRNLGINRNDIVGIMLPRSLELIISMLAVLKAGGTYIPIDPTYPKNRTEYMLENSQSKFLLTFSKLSKSLNFENTINVELDNNTIYSLENKNLKNVNEPLDSSYIIYTSGSTGLPKGVVLNHKALVNLSYYLNNYVDFLNGTSLVKNMLSVTTASFDIFIFETLICLQKGLKVILADEEEQRVPSLLNKLIEKENAQIIQMTPSRMQFLVDNKQEIPSISKLQYIILAGEPLPIHLL
ncbi:MAG: AMP-binding protein, partial [Lachnospiraceae bacterium]|nr:AMP-binding protein [Lachnospiraceae bacterium]